MSCLSCFLDCSLQPCGHLLGTLVCDVSYVFVTFSCGVLGQVWYLNVSIPDICLLTYFETSIAFISFLYNRFKFNDICTFIRRSMDYLPLSLGVNAGWL